MAKKIVSGFSLVFAIVFLCLSSMSCGKSGESIQVKGSDTMVNLGQAWAEKFMQDSPEITVAVTGGGSGTGIAALINGTTDIAMCSRKMKKKEISQAEKNGIVAHEIQVANDGIAIVVSPKNPIKSLTIKELSDIFSGKVTNWKAVGGPDKRIIGLSRDRNSGTHIFFLEEVVKLSEKKNPREFAKNILMMPSNQAIVEEVSVNDEAIGYIGLGYLNKRVKALAIGKGTKKPVTPSLKSVTDLSYPISRGLFMYTNGTPKDKIKTFIDFILSKKGQETVLEMDFVPLKK